MLGADLVFRTPFVGEIARKSGSTLASTPDAERLLAKGELVGVWPEGYKGIGKPFAERYRLQRFGRGGFVSAAIRAGVPIVPVLDRRCRGDLPDARQPRSRSRGCSACRTSRSRRRSRGSGPLGLVPLPSKWLIEFGEPIPTADLGSAAADDPMLVFNLTDQVRETIQQTLYRLLMQRRSVFCRRSSCVLLQDVVRPRPTDLAGRSSTCSSVATRAAEFARSFGRRRGSAISRSCSSCAASPRDCAGWGSPTVGTP